MRIQPPLLVHVGAAVLGFGAMVLTGAQARRAGRGPADPAADGVRRYFRPGVNWAARSLYLVPVFGFALLADSGGAFQAGNGFVVWGLFLWLVAVLTAEMVVWPGERRIQQVVSKWADPADTATAQNSTRLPAGCHCLGGPVRCLRRRVRDHDRQAVIAKP